MSKLFLGAGIKITLFIAVALLLSTCLPAQPVQQDGQISKVSILCRQLLLSDTAYATEQSYQLTDDILYTTDAEGYYQTLTPKGNWDDIDYHSTMRGSWRPSWHLYRLMLICRKYYNTRQRVYLEAVHKGLAFWIKNDFTAANWWHNNINVPFAYTSLILMLGRDATVDEMSFLDITLVQRIPFANATGQNLLWQLDNEARVALIHNNDTAFKRILHDMQDVIQVSANEGIQPDYSFQQHGPMLQFGNYGFHFINSLLFWMRVTAHTPFAFAADKQAIVFRYCSDGLRWTVYKGEMDITAIGRQIRSGYTSKRGTYLYNNFNLIKSFDKGDPCKYAVNGLSQQEPACALSGNKSFWRSDYMIQASGDRYMMSVKTHGPFVNKVESINAENLKGSFLNDGVCLIHRTGKEYKEIEPLWNWTMLPGITCDTSLDPSASAVFNTKNTAGFTGQVSNDSVGISAMQYNRLGITAYKSYFFINDMMVALGAGISAGNKTSLVTTVNQRLYNGRELQVGKQGEATTWLWQDSIAYIFPGADQQVTTDVSLRSSNWHVVDDASNKIVTDSVLSIYISHLHRDTYSYLVKPDVDLHTAKKLANKQPVQILSNSQQLQAIRSANTILAVFYAPGNLPITADKSIRVDQPCLLICKYEGSSSQWWIADPSRKNKAITVTFNGRQQQVVLPQASLAGSTVYLQK